GGQDDSKSSDPWKWSTTIKKRAEDGRFREMTPQARASIKKEKESDAAIRSAWNALATHRKELGDVQLRTLFAQDPKRAERFKLEAAGVFLDYSKNRITEKTVKLLLALAEHSHLRERIDAMFRGEKINTTENRAVLHVALRTPKGKSIFVDG